MEKRDIVECMILNGKGEFLLQKKTIDYRHAPGVWCFFGGEIEPGEDPEKAMRRELKEETGIDFSDLKLLKVTRYQIGSCEGTDHIFLAEFDSGLSKISLTEGAGLAFFAFEELDKTNIVPMDLNVIKDYIRKKG